MSQSFASMEYSPLPGLYIDLEVTAILALEEIPSRIEYLANIVAMLKMAREQVLVPTVLQEFAYTS